MTNAPSSAKIECSCIMLIANTSPYSAISAMTRHCHKLTQLAVIRCGCQMPSSASKHMLSCCAILGPCVIVAVANCHHRPRRRENWMRLRGSTCNCKTKTWSLCFAGIKLVCRSTFIPAIGLLNIASWILMSVAERRIVILPSP